MSCWSGNILSPTKDQILLDKYPALKEKYSIYQEHIHNFLELDKEIREFGIIKRFLNFKEYNQINAKYIKQKNLYKNAKMEYLMLQKLLWDY